MHETLLVMDCGLRPYQAIWRLQHRLVKARFEREIADVLLLVEHFPIITLGRKGNHRSIKVSPETLQRDGVSFMVVERGGDATFHGPGQIVGYPIFLLPGRGRKVRGFVESLEEAMIRVLGDFTIMGQRVSGTPGVWVGEAKIASIGITVHNEVSFHGFAMNIRTDLSGFSLIHPCGIKDAQVTSMERCLGKKVSMEQVKACLVEQIARIFHRKVQQVSLEAFPLTGLEELLSEEWYRFHYNESMS